MLIISKLFLLKSILALLLILLTPYHEKEVLWDSVHYTLYVTLHKIRNFITVLYKSRTSLEIFLKNVYVVAFF